jgi:hypothetical protein
MKRLRRISLFILVTALVALAGASTASATTLEVGGVTKNESVVLKASLKSGTSTTWSTTDEFFAGTCLASTIEGKTTTFTGFPIAAPLSTLSFSSCTEEPTVVDAPGSLSVEKIAGTTNGTVRSIGAKITMPSPYGGLNCVTASSPGTDIGTLTGVKSGNAIINMNAVLNCGFFLPSARWRGEYVVTSPTGLGVTV